MSMLPSATGDSGLAKQHAKDLLAALGMAAEPRPWAVHPALAWRRAGLMASTGHPERGGLVLPAALTSAAEGSLAALRALAPEGALPFTGWSLLGERARLLKLTRQGRISANGTCRLLETRRGTVALNLARPDDWASLPAMLGEPADDWAAIERAALGHDGDTLVAMGRELSMAIGLAERVPAKLTVPFVIERVANPGIRRVRPRVVDLSALWAGPLAGALMAMAGAEVVKVESRRRLDGARAGDPVFFDLLNGQKRSVMLDFHDRDDLALLQALIDQADIVIEASRPRALAQLGVDARSVAARGATWVSITAYGREGPAAEWIGFGDDVAVAGGLAHVMAEGWQHMLFAGDAVADPLTGILAALAGWAGWLAGGGKVISVPMVAVMRHALSLYRPARAELGRWQALAEADTEPLAGLRSPERAAVKPGSDLEWARQLAAQSRE